MLLNVIKHSFTLLILLINIFYRKKGGISEKVIFKAISCFYGKKGRKERLCNGVVRRFAIVKEKYQFCFFANKELTKTALDFMQFLHIMCTNKSPKMVGFFCKQNYFHGKNINIIKSIAC